MKKLFFIASLVLGLFCFSSCGSSEASEAKEKTESLGSYHSAEFKEWVSLGRTDSLEMLFDGGAYPVHNFTMAQGWNFSFELHSKGDTIYFTGSPNADQSKLTFYDNRLNQHMEDLRYYFDSNNGYGHVGEDYGQVSFRPRVGPKE